MTGKRAVLLTVALSGWACAATPGALDFEDALTGPVSPALAIPFDKYALTPGGLLRKHSESGTENGLERPIVKTRSGAYLSRDFIFEIEVTIPAEHGDIVFIGFGAGRSRIEADNEPTDAFVFRVHNLPNIPFYGIDMAIGDPDGGVGYKGRYREFHRLAEYTPGRPMRFQIAHRSGTVTMTIPSIPGAQITFSPDRFHELFDRSNAYLFFTNSSEGTTFKNATLRTP